MLDSQPNQSQSQWSWIFGAVKRSGVPRASRARVQSQFWRPHPDLSWQLRCEKWVGS